MEPEYFLNNLDNVTETIVTSFDTGDMEKFRIYFNFLSAGFELGVHIKP